MDLRVLHDLGREVPGRGIDPEEEIRRLQEREIVREVFHRMPISCERALTLSSCAVRAASNDANAEVPELRGSPQVGHFPGEHGPEIAIEPSSPLVGREGLNGGNSSAHELEVRHTIEDLRGSRWLPNAFSSWNRSRRSAP